MNNLIDVFMDDESINLAKIVNIGVKYTIVYLTCTDDTYHDIPVYSYDTNTYEIDTDCIAGYYDSSDITIAGFKRIGDNRFIFDEDDDSDYDPSEN
tara:strand:- start:35 stop:322 length:288 start_codon:yes stop_codon:yes gene_type:complete